MLLSFNIHGDTCRIHHGQLLQELDPIIFLLNSQSETRRTTVEGKHNLSAICNNSIFKDEKELLSELDSLEKLRTGTRIIIYNLTK